MRKGGKYTPFVTRKKNLFPFASPRNHSLREKFGNQRGMGRSTAGEGAHLSGKGEKGNQWGTESSAPSLWGGP